MRFCPRQGTQAVGAGGVQCPPAQFATSAPKISLPCAHILLSLTPTRSSGSDGDSDVDSELEERVDGVKSWLSKNKGSSKALSDDGSLKGSRWVQGWVAEDRVSCARGWTRYGGSTHGMSHSGCCACVAGQGRVNVMTSSVSTGDTCPPTQRGLRGPPPHHSACCTTVEAHGHHSPKPVCVPSIPSDRLYPCTSSPFSRVDPPQTSPHVSAITSRKGSHAHVPPWPAWSWGTHPHSHSPGKALAC